jgi:hypothetical protein
MECCGRGCFFAGRFFIRAPAYTWSRLMRTPVRPNEVKGLRPPSRLAGDYIAWVFGMPLAGFARYMATSARLIRSSWLVPSKGYTATPMLAVTPIE